MADLACEIPCLAVGTLQPVRVPNEVLRTGERGAGMSGGGRWEPFEVSPEEYDEPADALGLPVAAAFDWCERAKEIGTHLMIERRWDVPADKHRRLDETYGAAERAYCEARARDSADPSSMEGELLERYAESAEAGRRLSEFVSQYVVSGT